MTPPSELVAATKVKVHLLATATAKAKAVPVVAKPTRAPRIRLRGSIANDIPTYHRLKESVRDSLKLKQLRESIAAKGRSDS